MTNNQVASIIIEQIEELFNFRINLNDTVHKVSFFRTVGALDKNNLNSGKLIYSENSLLFAVSTPKLKGKVEIILNSMDTYDIRLYNKKDLFECKPTKEINDVYFDKLTSILVEELGI